MAYFLRYYYYYYRYGSGVLCSGEYIVPVV